MEQTSKIEDDAEIKLDKQISRAVKYVFIAIGLAAGGYTLWFQVIHQLTASTDPESWALFGDFFGGTVGPAIGLASVILLVSTLQLQRTALKEQRIQLTDAAAEAKKQNRLIAIQSFEQSFFGWLRDYRHQVSRFRFPKISTHAAVRNIAKIPEEHISTGENALFSMVNFFFANCLIAMQHVGDKEIQKQKVKNGLVSGWNQMYEHQGEAVRTYLRTLFGLLRWIDEQKTLEPAEKRHYASILRAQLSDYELILIYVNGLTQTGQPMNDYVNRYALFDNLEIHLYPTLVAIYDEEAPEPYLPSAFRTSQAIETHWKCN